MGETLFQNDYVNINNLLSKLSSLINAEGCLDIIIENMQGVHENRTAAVCDQNFHGTLCIHLRTFVVILNDLHLGILIS